MCVHGMIDSHSIIDLKISFIVALIIYDHWFRCVKSKDGYNMFSEVFLL